MPEEQLEHNTANGSQPSVTGWVCPRNLKYYEGDDTVASQHFEQPGCWSDWLYEFRFYPSLVRSWEATGRSIHTSDAGGYYIDQHKPEEIWEKFARTSIVAAKQGRTGEPAGHTRPEFLRWD